MRNWLTIVLLFVLLAGGGVLLSAISSGEPLSLTRGYIPQLDATQGFLLAVAVGFLAVSTAGMGATLAAMFFFGGRQIAAVRAQSAQNAASQDLREPSKAAPKPGPVRAINWGAAGRAGAIAANLLVLAFVAFLTVNHFVLNPPAEGEGRVEQPTAESAPPTAPAPAGPAEIQAAFAALPPGDAAAGQATFASQACAGCHSLAPDQTLVGPSLAGVATRAETRQPGYSPELYISESITHPGAYVVEGFQNGLMPPTFGQTLTPQQQADLVAFLLTEK